MSLLQAIEKSAWLLFFVSVYISLLTAVENSEDTGLVMLSAMAVSTSGLDGQI